MENLVRAEMKAAINNAFNGTDDNSLCKINYIEFLSPNKKHKFEMTDFAIMDGILGNVTINAGNTEEKKVTFAIPGVNSNDSLRLNWAYSNMMSAGFYDATCPDTNIKFDFGKEFKSGNNDKITLKITDTQAEDLEGFSYGENVDILKMPISVSTMKTHTKDIGDDEVVKALFKAKAAEKIAWYTGDEYKFWVSNKYNEISFESRDGGKEIRVFVGKRTTEYSMMETAEFDIKNPSFTIFELYELIKMKKGVFLYSLDGFGNPNTGWIFIAQGKNDIRFKFKDWRIDIEEEDVHKYSIENYKITNLLA